MGHGNYSHAAHAALMADRSSLPQQAVFQQQGCHALMNPKGLKEVNTVFMDNAPFGGTNRTFAGTRAK